MAPPIREFMIPHPYTVQYDEPLSAAEKMMNSHRVRHMPVTGGKKVMGIISDKDIIIAKQVYKNRTFEHEVLVKDVCLLDEYSVEESTPIDKAAHMMVEKRLDAVVVVKDGIPTGIFTTTDACRLIVELYRGGGRKGFLARLFS